MNNRTSPLLAPALSFLVVILIVESVIFAFRDKAVTEHRLRAMAFASDLRASAQRELSSVLDLTRGLTGYFSVNHDSLRDEEIMDILRVAYETHPQVRNFGVAVGYQLQYVYPRQGNQAAIGLDYRDLERQWPRVERAIEQREPVLAEGVRLVQGGRAFVYRDPIYIDDDYWGLLSTVIDEQPLLDRMFLRAQSEDRFDFAVRSLNGGGSRVLWGEPALFETGDPVLLRSERDWEFAVAAKPPNTHWLPVIVLRILGWLLAVVAALIVYGGLLGGARDDSGPAGGGPSPGP